MTIPAPSAWIVALVAALALLGPSAVAPDPARAQADAGPERLWDAYPLEGDGRAESVPAPTPTPTPSADDRAAPSRGRSDPSEVAILLAVGGALALALGVGVASRRRTAEPTGVDAVVGYISLTAAEQELEVAGLVDQEALIRQACAREGWRLDAVLCDDAHTLGNGRRPSLEQAIARIDAGEVSCLVVSQLDRLGRSAVELGGILRRLDAHEATLVSLDDGIDTSTDTGGKLAGMGASERGRIAGGVADTLDREGAPTLRNDALWRPSSVRAAGGHRRTRQDKTHPGGSNGDAG